MHIKLNLNAVGHEAHVWTDETGISLTHDGGYPDDIPNKRAQKSTLPFIGEYVQNQMATLDPISNMSMNRETLINQPGYKRRTV